MLCVTATATVCVCLTRESTYAFAHPVNACVCQWLYCSVFSECTCALVCCSVSGVYNRITAVTAHAFMCVYVWRQDEATGADVIFSPFPLYMAYH